MKDLCIISLLFLCVTCAAAAPRGRLPSVGNAVFGYNAFGGNPHAISGADPGFCNGQVFNFTFAGQETTADGRWLLPDNVLEPGIVRSCSVSGTTWTIESGLVYQSSLAQAAKVDLSNFKAAFSSNSDFQTVEYDTSVSKSVFVNSFADCQTYAIAMNASAHPVYTEDFTIAGSALPTTFDANNASRFWVFFDLFGTHYFSQVVVGSRWAVLFESSLKQWTDMKQSGLNIPVAASYAGQIMAGIDIKPSFAKQMAQNFTSHTQQRPHLTLLGVNPPSSGNPSDWLLDAANSNLMNPLQYVLEEIATLFSKAATSNPDLNARYQAVSDAVKQYCQLYLLPAGRVSSCNAPTK